MTINPSAFDDEDSANNALIHLSAEHQRMLLLGSGIAKRTIIERGYRTIKNPEELALLKFSETQQQLVPCLLIPQWGVDREIVQYQIRPDRPRDGRKYEFPAGAQMRLDVAPACFDEITDPRKELWITEGSKKVDAAVCRGLCCIGISGVWNWRGTNEKGGSVELADWDRIHLKGRKVYLAFDSDVTVKPQVLKALQRLARVLRRRGVHEILPIVIPSNGGEKVGLDDFFARDGSIRDLIDSVDEDLLASARIYVNNRGLADITTEALASLVESNIPPNIFVRAGELARVRTDEYGGHQIQDLTFASLRGYMARSAIYLKSGKTDIECAPPKEAVEDILALASWPDIPPLIAITQAPVLAPDGTLEQAPGYCPRSMYYIVGDGWPEWQGDTQSALSFIFDEFLCDFPFAGDADRAHALALMLLPIVRPIIQGPTPLHLIDAPVQGTGKSLLARLLLIPTQGSQIIAAPGSKDEEEWRKKLLAALLSGYPYIFLDNLSNKIDSEALAGILTAKEWGDRFLSTSKWVKTVVRCAWVATTNNATLSRDILRRSVWIRIDARVEDPTKRIGFKHGDIEQWTFKNRSVIVSALCKIIKNWIEKGMPSYTGTTMGSYEDYGNVIGGILNSTGLNGFLSNVDELRAHADDTRDSWADFYRRWYIHFKSVSVKSSELMEEFCVDELLSSSLGDRDNARRTANLGKALRQHVGVIFDGLMLEKSGTRAGSSNYRIVELITPDQATPTKTQATPTITPTTFLGSTETTPTIDLGSNGGGGGGNNNLHAHTHTHTRESRGPETPLPPPQVQDPHHFTSRPPPQPEWEGEV